MRSISIWCYFDFNYSLNLLSFNYPPFFYLLPLYIYYNRAFSFYSLLFYSCLFFYLSLSISSCMFFVLSTWGLFNYFFDNICFIYYNYWFLILNSFITSTSVRACWRCYSFLILKFDRKELMLYNYLFIAYIFSS